LGDRSRGDLRDTLKLLAAFCCTITANPCRGALHAPKTPIDRPEMIWDNLGHA
jgi:hypothetical protein